MMNYASLEGWPSACLLRSFETRCFATLLRIRTEKDSHPLGMRCSALSHRLLEVGRGLVPVHGVPPGLEVVGPAVLVLEIIGVLPDVDAEDRFGAERDRRVLIGGRRQLDLLVFVHNQPRPAGAEARCAGGAESLLEIVD